jgi:hypothetical protein
MSWLHHQCLSWQGTLADFDLCLRMQAEGENLAEKTQQQTQAQETCRHAYVS